MRSLRASLPIMGIANYYDKHILIQINHDAIIIGNPNSKLNYVIC